MAAFQMASPGTPALSPAAWTVHSSHISAGATQAVAKDMLDALPLSQAAVQAAKGLHGPAAAQAWWILHYCLHGLPAARRTRQGCLPAAYSPFRASRMGRDCTSSFSSLPSSTSSFKRACRRRWRPSQPPQRWAEPAAACPSARIATDQRGRGLVLPMPDSLCVSCESTADSCALSTASKGLLSTHPIRQKAPRLTSQSSFPPSLLRLLWRNFERERERDLPRGLGPRDVVRLPFLSSLPREGLRRWSASVQGACAQAEGRLSICAGATDGGHGCCAGRLVGSLWLRQARAEVLQRCACCAREWGRWQRLRRMAWAKLV